MIFLFETYFLLLAPNGLQEMNIIYEIYSVGLYIRYYILQSCHQALRGITGRFGAELLGLGTSYIKQLPKRAMFL